MSTTAFFAYPSQPSTLPETIGEAVKELNSGTSVSITTWQECRVGGRLVIKAILDKITASDLLMADVTGLNPNVLFELGYAIAIGKQVWIVRDSTFDEAAWREFRLLSTVHNATYTNHRDIVSRFYTEASQDSARPLLHDLEGSLAGTRGSLLYLKSQHDTTASLRVTERLQRQTSARLVIDDPTESPQTLIWYAQQAYRSVAMTCHFTDPRKSLASLRNARCALVAGMCVGFGKDVLMLAEGDFLAPLDYRDQLFNYQTAASAVRHLDDWLKEREPTWRLERASYAPSATAAELRTELRGLVLGEHVAENEEDASARQYFVETQAYRAALEGKQSLFVGRKGAGKSANFIHLSAQWSDDKRNVVCVIKPLAYDMNGLIELLSRYRERGTKGFVIENLWKFLLYSEAARSLSARLDQREVATLSDAEHGFRAFYGQHQELLDGDFAGRLEQCLAQLVAGTRSSNERGSDSTKQSVSEQLHIQILGPMRDKICAALPSGARVVFLVDNLDKTWEDYSGSGLPAEFLLGLLGVRERVRIEISRARPDLHASTVVFLRADIFERVKKSSPEPDKLASFQLNWADPELLRRVIEERYAIHAGVDNGTLLWRKHFCSTVRGVATTDYLIDQIIPRPRDLIYFVNAAIATAINRGHRRVEQSDILEAQKRYSEFAIESFQVENTVDNVRMDEIILEFVGQDVSMSKEAVMQCLGKGGVAPTQVDDVFWFLCRFSFLGFALGAQSARYPETEMELRKFQKLASNDRNARFVVHPAFRPYLEVVDPHLESPAPMIVESDEYA